MKKIIAILLMMLVACAAPKKCCGQINFKKLFKFSTFYTAVNGGTSLSNEDVFSVSTGALQSTVIKTPYDYNFAIGLRKIARFGMRIEHKHFMMVQNNLGQMALT